MRLAIVEKVHDPATQSTVFIAAGLGVVGTMGAVHFLAEHWNELWQQFGTRPFAICFEVPKCTSGSKCLQEADRAIQICGRGLLRNEWSRRAVRHVQSCRRGARLIRGVRPLGRAQFRIVGALFVKIKSAAWGASWGFRKSESRLQLLCSLSSSLLYQPHFFFSSA